jgi:2-polyprenyl-3-methyl-5-hydroxy-6-metoxy-1,4-benzoquinol methylase
MRARFTRGELVLLRGYASLPWADTIADRTTEVAEALYDFLARAECEDPLPAANVPECEGEIGGITYRVRGQGPPLLVLPLSLAPAQWEPLASQLTEHYCIISLSGAHLGAVALLEARASSGYGQLVGQVVDRAHLAPGETVIEVGCGSGALTRTLVQRTACANLIVATDINPYLLAESEALAARHGVVRAVSFERANGEDLAYPDERFDVAICCTVLEEGDADRMISELARVTRPEGRIVAITRAIDMDWWVNLPISNEFRGKMNALGTGTGGNVGVGGCADASLYARLFRTGLRPVMMGPQFAIYREGKRLSDVLDRLLAPLSDREVRACRDAIGKAEKDGTLFVAEPFHCAVGGKLRDD